jgi:hypothetical protein
MLRVRDHLSKLLVNYMGTEIQIKNYCKSIFDEQLFRAFDIGQVFRCRYFDIENFQFPDSDIKSLQFDDEIY